jgi:hypothetical protein
MSHELIKSGMPHEANSGWTVTVPEQFYNSHLGFLWPGGYN